MTHNELKRALLPMTELSGFPSTHITLKESALLAEESWPSEFHPHFGPGDVEDWDPPFDEEKEWEKHCDYKSFLMFGGDPWWAL